jgi:hypothetical protein
MTMGAFIIEAVRLAGPNPRGDLARVDLRHGDLRITGATLGPSKTGAVSLLLPRPWREGERILFASRDAWGEATRAAVAAVQALTGQPVPGFTDRPQAEMTASARPVGRDGASGRGRQPAEPQP